MKKGIGSIVVLIIVVIGAYFTGGLDSVLEVVGIDIKEPVITHTEINDEVDYLYDFSEFEVSCTDNIDEECEVSIEGEFLSDELGEYEVILKAVDEAGNVSKVTITYSVVDLTPPTFDDSTFLLSISQDSEIYLTCSDNYDAECTVDFEADTSDLGEHSIMVSATDEAGNSAYYIYEYTVFEGMQSDIPLGYYDGIEGLSGQSLITALNAIITNHTEYPYTSTATDVWDILRQADEDPDNSENIIMFYTGVSHPKDCQDTTYPPDYCEANVYGELKITEWNREHIWSKSRGSFADDDFIAHNDTHHLVAAERVMNSTKNNRYFEDCHDGDDSNIVDRGYGNYTCNTWEFEPRDEVKGDVARMLFYMAVRYEGHLEYDDGFDLKLANDPDEDKALHVPIYGDLDDLLRWHLEDPVSDWEIRRNEIIFGFQGNRNPFIDHPELVELIWGNPEDYN